MCKKKEELLLHVIPTSLETKKNLITLQKNLKKENSLKIEYKKSNKRKVVSFCNSKKLERCFYFLYIFIFNKFQAFNEQCHDDILYGRNIIKD